MKNRVTANFLKNVSWKKFYRLISGVIFFFIFLFIIGCSVELKPTPITPSSSNVFQTQEESASATQSPSPDSVVEAIDSLATAQALAEGIQFTTSKPPVETPTTWIPWIQNRGYPISSLNSSDYSDLEFLKPLLKDQRIVQLGEYTHRGAEVSSMKVRLIKYLHQELGYDVIAFESSLPDCYLTNQKMDQLSAREAMEGCIFGVWHTEEVLPLFEYITHTSTSSHPLTLAGFDIQDSGSAHLQSPDFYYKYVNEIDPEYADEIRELEQLYINSDNLLSFSDDVKEILGIDDPIQMYDDLALFFEENQEELKKLHPEEENIPVVARQAAWSRARFLEEINLSEAASEKESVALRDRSMATNVNFLLKELYPEKKIILWAANFHISEVSTAQNIQNMGSFLSAQYSDQLYTIGFISQNTQSIYTLETLCHLYGEPILFIDLAPIQSSEMNEGLFRPQLMGHNQAASEYYDALIFIDEVTFPNYLETIPDN